MLWWVELWTNLQQFNSGGIYVKQQLQNKRFLMCLPHCVQFLKFPTKEQSERSVCVSV